MWVSGIGYFLWYRGNGWSGSYVSIVLTMFHIFFIRVAIHMSGDHQYFVYSGWEAWVVNHASIGGWELIVPIQGYIGINRMVWGLLGFYMGTSSGIWIQWIQTLLMGEHDNCTPRTIIRIWYFPCDLVLWS